MQADPAAQTASRAAAERIVKRYNNAMFAVVGAWVGVVVLFWSRALGPLRPYDVAAPDTTVWLWLALGTILGAAAMWLPGAYYRPRAFEMRGRFYEGLGMKALRLVITDGDMITRAARRKDPSYRKYDFSDRLEGILQAGVASEKSHHALWWFGVATGACALAADWIGWAITLLAWNILANLLPMLLQRYTRARLARLKPELVAGFLASKISAGS